MGLAEHGAQRKHSSKQGPDPAAGTQAAATALVGSLPVSLPVLPPVRCDEASEGVVAGVVPSLQEGFEGLLCLPGLASHAVGSGQRLVGYCVVLGHGIKQLLCRLPGPILAQG